MPSKNSTVPYNFFCKRCKRRFKIYERKHKPFPVRKHCPECGDYIDVVPYSPDRHHKKVRFWTMKEVQFLAEHMNTMPTREIANALGRTLKAVQLQKEKMRKKVQNELQSPDLL